MDHLADVESREGEHGQRRDREHPRRSRPAQHAYGEQERRRRGEHGERRAFDVDAEDARLGLGPAAGLVAGPGTLLAFALGLACVRVGCPANLLASLTCVPVAPRARRSRRGRTAPWRW
jgi:hypothetical protein